MTATISQDFTTYVGDAAQPVWTVQNASGQPVDISGVADIRWTLSRNSASAAVLTKTKVGGQITFVATGTNGQFQVALQPGDTANLSGFYVYTAAIVDSLGNPTTVATGRMRVGVEPAWTYDSTQLPTSPLYQVRRLIGDVIWTDPQIADNEILFALTQRSSIYGAAADCCRFIASQYSRKADVVTQSPAGGALKTNYSQQAKSYLAMAAQFENLSMGRSGAMPYAGGVSVSDKQTNESDPDRVAPQFNIGLDDNYLPDGVVSNELPSNAPSDSGLGGGG